MPPIWISNLSDSLYRGKEILFKIIMSYFFPASQSGLTGGSTETESFLSKTVFSANDFDMVETGSCSVAEQPVEGSLNDDQEEDTQANLIRDVGLQAGERLTEIRELLQALCESTDPQFIQVARDLRKVSAESKALTQSMLATAQLVGEEAKDAGILEKTKNMIMTILGRLATGRRSLESSTKNVRKLINQIHAFHAINDEISTISSHFKVVRFNIRIQCSALLVSETMFKSVIEDIDSLSAKLHSITAQIKNDLTTSGKKLVDLEHSVSSNLMRLQTNAPEAEESVQHILKDIEHLMQGAAVMIDEARSRSERISRKVEDVVVSIQFHDSMNQRIDHVIRALEDASSLGNTKENDISANNLGSCWLIVELQHRQLVQIIDEIGSVKKSILNAFQIIEEEVSGLNAIQCREDFEAIGPQQFLGNRFASLERTLVKLSELLSESGSMLQQMRKSAGDTENVAAGLREMMEDIQDVREDTRLQAVNTIIMASNLGQKGRTIQVLAKEINNLSDQTGEVAAEAKKMQSAINKKVEELMQRSDEENGTVDSAEVDALAQNISESCSEVEQKIADVSNGILTAGNNIDSIRSGLVFLDDLQDRLGNLTKRLESVKELLSPWHENASMDSEELQQLIERYTMDRERDIHSSDQVEKGEEDQGDEDIFF